MSKTVIRKLAGGNVLVSFPINLRWNGNSNGRRVVDGDGQDGNTARDNFLLALARGMRWQRLIDSGQMPSTRAIAAAIGKDVAFVAHCIRLTYLAPEIIEAAVRGEIPAGLSTNFMRQSIPDSWREQMRMLREE